MKNNFSKYDDEFKKSLVNMYQNGIAKKVKKCII